MLQRELEHRGLDKVNRGFESKLIAWVEAVVKRVTWRYHSLPDPLRLIGDLRINA